MKMQRVGQLVVIYCALILIGLFCYLAPHLFISDSELWSIAMGHHLTEDFRNAWVFTRPLYHFLLWLTQWPLELPGHSIWAARGLFVLNALVISGLLLKISRQVSGNFFAGFIAVVVLFGNTGFMNQGFRVRSDLLAATVGLAVYAWTLNRKKNLKTGLWFLLVPLLATPKGAIYVLSIALSRIRSFRISSLYPWQIFSGLTLIAVILILNRSNLLFLSHYFINNTGPAYWSFDSWEHVFNQIQRNIPFWLLFFSGLFVFRREQGSYKTFKNFAMISFVLMVLTPGKTQFFIASFLPIFSLQIGFFLSRSWRAGFWNVGRSLLVPLVALYSLALGAYWFDRNLYENHNFLQVKTLNGLYKVIKNRNLEFFDGTCLIPSLCSYRYFVGPNQPEANDGALLVLNHRPPELFFYLRKTVLLEPGISALLEKRYVDLGWGVFILASQNGKIEDIKNEPGYQAVRASLANTLDTLFGYDLDY